MTLLRALVFALASLASAAPALAASTCSPPAAVPPLRRSGTATVKVTGSRTAEGTFPAVCGAYVLADVPKVAKAGDGLAFQTCIPGIGTLQVSGTKRSAGLSEDAGLVVNTDSGSYVASADKGNRVVIGTDLFSAAVNAVLRPVRRTKTGAPPDELRIEARFDCPK